jgi:ABC-type multidrug transport system fused ATPase/permease subunit
LKPSIHTADITNLLMRFWRHLRQRRQRQFWLILGLVFVSALTEVVSLGAVLPFLGILIAPEKVFSQSIVGDMGRTWGITSADQLVLPLTVVFITVALMAGIIRVIVLWVNTRFTVACGVELSGEVYRRTLDQPYRVHVARNSSEVISSISSKVNGVVFGVLLQLLNLISSTVLVVAVTVALIAIDPLVALVVAVGFGVSYGLITRFVRDRLKHNSECVAREHVQVIKALQEGLGGIRDVLLNGTQSVYCDIYRKADYPLRRAHGDNSFITGCPRFAMEAIGMTLIAILAYGLSYRTGGITAALPVLGSLALGAQRLLPALQQSYGAWASIVGNRASLADTIDFLDQPLPAELLKVEPAPAPLVFLRTIRFEKVRFHYGSDGPWVLDEISFTIPKGARIGFVGSTGSGKSTTLDILMGLLEPTEGKFLVDDQPISADRVRAWQQTIAHVPQSIYLTDSSLAENIACGVPHGAIDLKRVQQVARQARIADFIENQAGGYDALVGEQGARLSGGQRQRIGIARALYQEACVLVFDEATSALDNKTEQSVMEAIERLPDDVTLLIVAHRLTTVKNCDTIVELENGRVVAQGTYEQLLASSPSFRQMSRVGNHSSLT